MAAKPANLVLADEKPAEFLALYEEVLALLGGKKRGSKLRKYAAAAVASSVFAANRHAGPPMLAYRQLVIGQPSHSEARRQALAEATERARVWTTYWDAAAAQVEALHKLERALGVGVEPSARVRTDGPRLVNGGT